MKNITLKSLAILVLLMVFSCGDLSELNENSNGVEPDATNPNLVMPTVLTSAFKKIVNLNYLDIAGVVQHTQKDAWFSEHNDYDWSNQSWTDYYGILRNNELVLNAAEEDDLQFHKGVSLIMKSLVFGLITDLWGDAPYTEALQGDEGNIYPAFDDQETIYTGVIADLETANELLSKDDSEYPEITDDVKSADVIYEGKPDGWRRMANSLLLRFYMRLSEKKPDVAKQGVEKIVGNPSEYPIIENASQDAVMSFPGNSASDSWPTAVFSSSDLSNYKRIRMCATLVDKLQELNDPRLAVWAKKIEIPLVVSSDFPEGTDELVDLDDDGTDDVRHLSPDVVEGINVDTDPDYVGIPPSVSAMPSAYNMGPQPGQTSVNPHVSYLNEMYSEASGDLLKARVISAAETHFIIAEAALKGWSVGGTAAAQEHYEAGIDASLETWGVSDASYKTNDGVAYEGTLEQVMEQKWIASWTAGTEAWFDYRRTGLPAFQAGVAAKRTELPVRYYYMTSELDINTESASVALDKLEITSFSQADGKNSAWSKPWIIQDTGKPWD